MHGVLAGLREAVSHADHWLTARLPCPTAFRPASTGKDTAHEPAGCATGRRQHITATPPPPISLWQAFALWLSRRRTRKNRQVIRSGVTFTPEDEQRIEFRPLGIFTRCLVSEHLVHLSLFKLAIRVLIEAADPNIPDALTFEGCLLNERICDPLSQQS